MGTYSGDSGHGPEALKLSPISASRRRSSVLSFPRRRDRAIFAVVILCLPPAWSCLNLSRRVFPVVSYPAAPAGRVRDTGLWFYRCCGRAVHPCPAHCAGWPHGGWDSRLPSALPGSRRSGRTRRVCASVNGHREIRLDGLVISRLAATRFPGWWPPVLPAGGLGCQRDHPLAREGLGEPVRVALGQDEVGVVEQPVDGGGGEGLRHDRIES